MLKIATYVFIDLETSGLPKEENNRTKITEISMIAVKREHVLATRPGASPRIQNKLTLCLNPRKLINPDCTEITGLSNELLQNETHFDLRVYNIVNNFLEILAKPVCLIAQNGMQFDFPILKEHVEKLNVSFASDLACADSFHAFYDILEAQKKSLCNVENNELKTTVLQKSDEIDTSNLYELENTLHMKNINETTPKQVVQPCANTPVKRSNGVCKARRRFPWSEGAKPKESYKLNHIYERLLNRPALDAHRAENDCILALESSVAVGKEFVEWVDENYILFTKVNPMTIGVPLGQ